MIGRRATVGLSLLCALMFCALAAQSATAQKVGIEKVVKAVNTTAFTCVKGGGEDFADAHCDEKVGGKFGHAKIDPGSKTDIEVSNAETANKTTEAASATLKGVLAGVTVEVTCKTASPGKETSYIENVNHEAAKQHTVKGTISVAFSGCEVKKPAKCVVKEPIETLAEFQGVEGLKLQTPGEPPVVHENTMGVEFKGDPNEEAAFAKLTLENKGAEKCALAGKVLEVFGTAIATGTPAPTQANKHSGATSVFEPGNGMQTLEVGKGTGQKAEFTGTFTTRMAEVNKVKQDPISLTTNT